MGAVDMNLDLINEFVRITKLKESKQISRMGVLFTTEFSNYFYDTGTGKVLMLDDGIYFLFDALFSENTSTAVWDNVANNSIDNLYEFLQTIVSQNLLLCPEVKRLYTGKHFDNLQENVEKNLQQVTLELTGKCNLRCGYCIYNDSYEKNRTFNQNVMSYEIAKAAIDYCVIHSNDEIAVTFYGGEPLLEFSLMKWTIEYALEKLHDKKLTFSLTTNLTLVNEEIAEYLASIENLSVVCSLDGPPKVQNSYRKFCDGKGSYQDAIRGLETLSRAFAKSLKNRLAINAVLAPPYTYEKINEINDFFKTLPYLKPNTNISIGYAAANSVLDSKAKNAALYKNPKYCCNSEGKVNPLWIWQKKQTEINSKLSSEDNNIYYFTIQNALYNIHNRLILDNPVDMFPLNGCCVPGSRRLYISTNGDLSICERIGTSPIIGNILTGIEIEKIKKYYVDDYVEKSLSDCSQCWAVRLCQVCYAGVFSLNGLDIEQKRTHCKSMRDSLLSHLSLYHLLVETNFEKLEFLKEIVMD